MEKEKQVFRNNAEMMAYLRGKAEKLEPKSVREPEKPAEIEEKAEEKPKKTRKRKKKDVVQAE